MSVELNADQRRVHANLKHKFGPLRESDVVGWSPEDLALAESWYGSGNGLDSPEAPAFLAEAFATAKAEIEAAREAEKAVATRELIAATIALYKAQEDHRVACIRMAGAFEGDSRPVVCNGNVIIRNRCGGYDIRGIKRIP
jgi:hypothetical protein